MTEVAAPSARENKRNFRMGKKIKKISAVSARTVNEDVAATALFFIFLRGALLFYFVRDDLPNRKPWWRVKKMLNIPVHKFYLFYKARQRIAWSDPCKVQKKGEMNWRPT